MLPLFALLSTANGAELFWDGHYRAQAHLYRSLSLSESNPNRIQQIDYLNHWLKLNPVFRAAPNVAVHAQLDTLYLQNFGATGVLDSDQIIGDESLYFSQRMEPDSIDGARGSDTGASRPSQDVFPGQLADVSVLGMPFPGCCR